MSVDLESLLTGNWNTVCEGFDLHHLYDSIATIQCAGKCFCGQQVCSGPGNVCTQRAKPPYALQRRGEQSGDPTFYPSLML